MTETSRPTKRMKYDLRATFDIVVGQDPAERFTVYTDVFTSRSKFLAATRKPEWLAGDTARPADLSDEDPKIFQAYLNCVYFGAEVLQEHAAEFERQVAASNVELYVCVTNPNLAEHWVAKAFEEVGFKTKSVRFKMRTSRTSSYNVEFEDTDNATKALADCNQKDLGGYFVSMCESAACDQMANPARSGLADTGSEALIKLYLLADKLQDLATANMVVDELISFVAKTAEIPKYAPTSLAYNSTASGDPLRKLLRDYWVYQIPTDGIIHLEANDFPRDFLQDVTTEFMRLERSAVNSKDYEQKKRYDECLYHQHDDEHPRCGAQ